MRICAQDWGWEDPTTPVEPVTTPTDLQYLNTATESMADLFIADANYFNKTDKWVKQRFRETYQNESLVRDELITRLMDQAVSGAQRLPAPYARLAVGALESVDWDGLADVYMASYGGPQYMSEEEELAGYEQEIQDIPGTTYLPPL